MRLLDVGCGWGGMVRHAAREYGVEVIGVTLSREQASWGQAAVERDGLADRAEVRYGDYREVAETGFDAVSSIGLTEHIGVRNYPSYFSFLRDKLVPGGRILNHCITRSHNHARATTGAFIDRYVFPDGELTGSGRIITAMQDVGLEVRHEENLREHYAMTLTAWCENLVDHWDECVAEVGEGTAKVWGLYMAGSRLSFERNEIQLHQVLGVRPDAQGRSGFQLRESWVGEPAGPTPARDNRRSLFTRNPSRPRCDSGSRACIRGRGRDNTKRRGGRPGSEQHLLPCPGGAAARREGSVIHPPSPHAEHPRGAADGGAERRPRVGRACRRP